MKPGGVFIFNTFRNSPSKELVVNEYKFNDRLYVEINWLVHKTIHHVQITSGYAPHTTEFQWITPEEFIELTSDFEVKVIHEEKTDIYICEKI